jgi:predicted nucleic-acid-binding protein
MIALDTNILVRYVTNDDPDQARRAADLLSGPETVFLAHTVLLEMEWVLRAVYGLDRPSILTAYRQVLGLATVRIDQPALIVEALERYENGFDFADALHLAVSGAATHLYTFDQRFARIAADDGVRLA